MPQLRHRQEGPQEVKASPQTPPSPSKTGPCPCRVPELGDGSHETTQTQSWAVTPDSTGQSLVLLDLQRRSCIYSDVPRQGRVPPACTELCRAGEPRGGGGGRRRPGKGRVSALGGGPAGRAGQGARCREKLIDRVSWWQQQGFLEPRSLQLARSDEGSAGFT